MRTNTLHPRGGHISVPPYLCLFNSDILPDQFDTPMFWNETELKELTGTEVVSRIGKQKSEEQYTQLLLPLITAHPNLFDPSKCKMDAFHRMGSLVLAYSFGNSDSSDDESESGHTEIAMVPLADMLNANPLLNNVSHPISELIVGAIISSW
jgi:N-lysine methyltransferase SETD6